MISRIAIVNRGEAAMRLIHAVRDLNAAARPCGHRIETVALHTEGERTAMFVREADHAYDLGPASRAPLPRPRRPRARPARDRRRRRLGRLGLRRRGPGVRRAVRAHRRHLHRPEPRGDAQARRQDRLQAHRRGGRRARSRRGAAAASTPSRTPPPRPRASATRSCSRRPPAAAAAASAASTPTPTSPTPTSAPATRRSARSARGVVFLEKLVTGARHVEVQVIADGQGTAWAVGVRDCSVQRRNQKVIEESASPVLSAEQEDEVKRTSAERLAIAVGYAGAGTVEFLYHPGERFFAFLEVNTRLQVEHPITEVVTDTDLVKLQIHVANGGRLETPGGRPDRARPRRRGPAQRRGPRPRLRAVARAASRLLELPAGPGIRVDTGVGEGDSIPADFDSMIAKIIAYGRDRDEALARLRRAMAETTVVIEGGATNKSFILDLLDQPEVIDGSRRHRLDRPGPRRGPARLAPRTPASRSSPPASRPTRTPRPSSAPACSRRPAAVARRCSTTVGRAIDLKLRGTAYKVTVLPHRRRTATASPSPNGGDEHVVDADARPHRRVRQPDHRRGPRRTASSPPPTGRSTSSRSTASPTASAATRAASLRSPAPGARRRDPGRGRATRSPPARRCSCSSR